MQGLKHASAAIALMIPHALMAATGSSFVPDTTTVQSQPAAESVDVITQRLARALAYEHGEGLPKDQHTAAAIYCETAAAGNAEAAFRLGWMYANGRGVAHDDGIAAALFDLAAEQGHAYARNARQRMPD